MYQPGQFLEVDGKTIRLNKETAAIANAVKKAIEWNPEENPNVAALKDWKRGEEAPPN